MLQFSFTPFRAINIKVIIISVLLLFVSSISAKAQDYSLGSEGIKAGTLPGKGFYYVMYNQYFTSDVYRDSSGSKINKAPEISSFANVHRFVFMTDKKFLGADYGMNVIVPAVYLDIKTPAKRDNEFSIGDINIEPLTLAWHGAAYDAVAAMSIFLPTGEYNKNHLANVGSDHYTIMTTLGGTYYPDTLKAWSVSVLSRYEKHIKNQDLDIRYGDDLSVEWGIGHKSGLFEAGIAGYAHWQLTDDSGADAGWDKSVHDRKFGVGPELNMIIPAINSQLKFKYYKEFKAVDTTEGDAFWLTLSTKL